MIGDAFQLLWPPFLVAAVLVGIHTYLGLQVLARNIVFVDLALAQIAALGATVAFMLGHPVSSPASYGYSLFFALCAAMLLATTRGWSGRISQEAIIGVIYVVAAAGGFLMVEKAPQGTEHIKQVLTGNILTAGAGELVWVVPLYAVIGAVLWAARGRLAHALPGWRGWAWDFLFYACFGVVVTSSVALAGVLLVFSFLIIPAAIGILYASGTARLFVGWAVGIVATTAGLALSYAADLPTGSTLVCVFGAALALAAALRATVFANTDRRRAGARTARMALAAVLAASGVWFAFQPRADQPLIDTVERAFPAMRDAYMSPGETAMYRDAVHYADRYRGEAERLNDREARSRWQGDPISDMDVRRLSSYVQSYNEMRKGEEFVQREVRNRARERSRWPIGAGLLLGGAFIFPWRRRRTAELQAVHS